MCFKNLWLLLVFLVLIEADDYTDINVDVVDDFGNSLSFFDGGMMHGGYQLAMSFVDCILDEVDPNEFLEVDKGSHEISLKTLTYDRLNQFSGLVTLFVFLLGFAVLFPICGLIYSCCRCCGKCGAKSRPRHKNSDHCHKIWQGSLMIVLLVGLLFCMWVAFGSGEGMVKGVQKLPSNLKNNIQDLKLYFDNTNSQLNTLLLTNFQEFRNKITTDIGDLVTNIKGKLQNLPNFDDTLQVVGEFESGIGDVTMILDEFLKTGSEFQLSSSTKNEEVIKCLQDTCRIQCFIYIKTFQDIQIDLQLDNFKPLQESLTSIKVDDIVQPLRDITEAYKNLANNIDDEINKKLITINLDLNEAEDEIKKSWGDVQKTLNDVSTILDNNLEWVIDDVQSIDQYLVYVHVVTAIFACILLVTVLCIILGLLWGTFGRVATAKKNNCASKKVGSKFMICAVGLMFSFAFFYALVALLFSIVGILPQKIVCEPMRHPKDSKIMQLLDDAIVFSSDIKVTISDVITNCEDNLGIYKAFQLNDQFDLDKIKLNLDLDDALETTKKAIDELFPVIPNNIIDQTQLNNFVETLNTFNFEIADITSIISSIDNAVDILPTQADPCKPKAQEYQKYVTDTYETIEQSITTLKTNIESKKIPETIQKLYETTETLKTTLNQQKQKIIEITDKFTTTIQSKIEIYLNRILTNIENEIGKCKPIHQTLQNILTSTCDVILQPTNGFWISLFWALVFFIPMIFLATSLASLYQKVDDFDLYKSTEHYIYQDYRNDDYYDYNYNRPRDNTFNYY